MRTRRAVLCAAIGGLLWMGPVLGCGGSSTPDDVYAKARPGIDFDQYETFALVSQDDLAMLPEAPEVPTEDLPDDIQAGLQATQEAVGDELEARGLREVDVDASPDLYVVDFAATSDEDGIYWECVPGWYWWGWYSYWDSCAWLRPIEVSYTVGSVLVLVIDEDIEPDEEHGRAVFGGLLQGVVDGSGDGEQRIADGVETMFTVWPD